MSSSEGKQRGVATLDAKQTESDHQVVRRLTNRPADRRAL